MLQAERRDRPSSGKLLTEVHNFVSGLASMLGSAKSAASEYGQYLSAAISRIPSSPSGEELSSIVSNIMQATGKMTERSFHLETQLGRASSKVGELGEYIETTKKESLTDALTNLANRRAFDARIATCTQEAKTFNSPLTLLMLDVDHFKRFNDTFGHAMGDHVLRIVSSMIFNNIKGRDMGARYGGEEFAVILPRTPLAGGQQVAEVLRRVVENKQIVDRDTKEKIGRVTVSIGVAQYKTGEDVASFIGRADKALYAAKNSGRNRICAG